MYVSTGSKQVEGWFARTDAEIFRALLVGQSGKKLSGSVVEIGVHHGKSFIAMCLGLQDEEKAYCVDIFQYQRLNKDLSGKGDRTVFESNLAKFGVSREKVFIDTRSSQQVQPTDIVNAVGPVRLFSVDGGHWLDIVKTDLRLAESSLSDHGVIALDDFHRPEWPDVSAGYFAWYASRSRPIVPFAIGFNKLYLCHEHWVDFYIRLLAEDPFIGRFLMKYHEFQGVWVAVYQQYIRPELSPWHRLFAYLRVFAPDLYWRLVRFENAADWREVARLLLKL